MQRGDEDDGECRRTESSGNGQRPSLSCGARHHAPVLAVLRDRSETLSQSMDTMDNVRARCCSYRSVPKSHHSTCQQVHMMFSLASVNGHKSAETISNVYRPTVYIINQQSGCPKITDAVADVNAIRTLEPDMTYIATQSWTEHSVEIR